MLWRGPPAPGPMYLTEPLRHRLSIIKTRAVRACRRAASRSSGTITVRRQAHFDEHRLVLAKLPGRRPGTKYLAFIVVPSRAPKVVGRAMRSPVKPPGWVGSGPSATCVVNFDGLARQLQSARPGKGSLQTMPGHRHRAQQTSCRAYALRQGAQMQLAVVRTG